MDHVESKNRSYASEANYPIGTHVTLADPVARNKPVDGDWDNLRRVEIAAGEIVQVVSYSNAGFRGIEVSLTKGDGDTLHGVSAGLIANGI